jgi:hypothetical protein
MEPLIYYPRFEPPSENWLKFALLYFEEFRPIVPREKRGLLSESFRRILDNTDLVNLLDPEYRDGYSASIRAINETEHILKNTYERSPQFREINLARKWRDPDNWTFLLYREKFSEDWIHFCEREHIGRRSGDGVMLPEELAFVYMTYLAKEIGFRENAAIITDDERFDEFTNFSRAPSILFQRTRNFAKGIINLLVPGNLAGIPMQNIIEFRNRNRDNIRAFNQELDRMQLLIGQGNAEQQFIDQYNHTHSDFSREIIAQGFGIAAIPFVMYVLIHNPSTTAPEYIKEILGAIGGILGGRYVYHKGLKETESRRYCKKYLTNLTRLN